MTSTHQRRIRGLMESLNVQTRFQLARQAIRRGWLTDDRVNGHGERRAQNSANGDASLRPVERARSGSPKVAPQDAVG